MTSRTMDFRTHNGVLKPGVIVIPSMVSVCTRGTCKQVKGKSITSVLILKTPIKGVTYEAWKLQRNTTHLNISLLL